MTIGSVGVGTAVDGAAGVRWNFLRSSSRQKTDNGRNDAQHQNETRYANTNGKTSLRYADGVVRSLQSHNEKVKHYH